MARAPQSQQPYHRSASSSSTRSSRHSSSSISHQTADNLNVSNTSSGSQNKSKRGGNASSSAASTTASSASRNAPATSPSPTSGSNNKKLTSTSTLPAILSIPLSIVQFVYRLIRIAFGYYTFGQLGEDVAPGVNNIDDVLESVLGSERNPDDEDDDEYLSVKASPGLTTLLDEALYRAYEAELIPTVSAASQLLTEFIQMKEASALILRDCRWMVGMPFNGGMILPPMAPVTNGGRYGAIHRVAIGTEVLNDVFLGEGACVKENGKPLIQLGVDEDGQPIFPPDNGKPFTTDGATEAMHAEEIANWNEFDTVQDFARQCYQMSNEAIQRLTTDRLAESANVTLQDSIASEVESIGTFDHTSGLPSQSSGANQHNMPQSPAPTASTTISSFSSPADAGIGRCCQPQPRRNCWESPRLYCPDYYWADDAIGGCQRILKTLSKHRFVSLVASHNGSYWERYSSIKSIKAKIDESGVDWSRNSTRWSGNEMSYMLPCTEAATGQNSMLIFPSYECAHALEYLVTEILPVAIPTRLNQFRAAAEANAVVSKRLYLVKCEYRAPMRALWESYANLNAAPKVELVERYLREYHGVKVGAEKSTDGGGSSEGGGGSSSSSGGGGGGGSGKSNLRRKGSAESTKKSAIQQKREKLEKLITEKYWKHPALTEALQLERCCERMEIEMSQMLAPLSNLAAEIMNGWKGRLRAVAVASPTEVSGGERNPMQPPYQIRIALDWQDVPFMRELLRRLKSILRRKPDEPDESTGIRPLLLDLQGIYRHKQGPIDSSLEMPFYGIFIAEEVKDDDEWARWSYLKLFLKGVSQLLDLLDIPNIPFLVEDSASKGDKNALLDLVEQCKEVWDEEMFRAQYMDWFDMVKRQQELNKGWANDKTDDGSTHDEPTSLAELSETIREAEIELSIAMASKDQLERVHKRLEALRADKTARYKVLAQIVFDVGYRELNDGIVVEPPADDATVEFPKLSSLGLFGEQLTMSGEILPVG